MRTALLLLLTVLIASGPGAADELPGPDPRVMVDLVTLEYELCLAACDLEVLERSLEAVLLRRPLHPVALAGLGEVDRRQGRPAAALGRAEQALTTARGRLSHRVWVLKADALIDLRDPVLAIDAARRAVALEPQDPRCLEVLARALYRSGDMEGAGEILRRTTRLCPRSEEANLRLGTGFGRAIEGAPWRDGPLAPGFEVAVGAWMAGDLRAAEAGFAGLCGAAPDVYKFRLCLGLVRREARRRAEVAFGGRAEELYALLPAPDVAGLDAFVPGYAAVDPVAAHVIRVVVAPARRWLPGLLGAGATHTVLSIDESLADVVDGVRGLQTFDGRHYEHLRGVGGQRAASGVERLHVAARFAYNVFAHEFAHQILRYAFPADLQAEVEALYARAVLEDRCLDWYAAANADEYFAQGYEAFVSHVKRGCLKDTQRHTRAELERRDPALYAFLASHLDTSHEGVEALAVFHEQTRAPR